MRTCLHQPYHELTTSVSENMPASIISWTDDTSYENMPASTMSWTDDTSYENMPESTLSWTDDISQHTPLQTLIIIIFPPFLPWYCLSLHGRGGLCVKWCCIKDCTLYNGVFSSLWPLSVSVWTFFCCKRNLLWWGLRNAYVIHGIKTSVSKAIWYHVHLTKQWY